MFTKVHARLCGVFLSAALTVGLTASANAASVNGASLNMMSFDRSDLAAAQQARSDYLASYRVLSKHSETFEDQKAWNGSHGTTNPQKTQVGSFSTLGGKGSGHSVINGGSGLEVRDDNSMNWGRYDADKTASNAVGGKWLDSNDTLGMKWKISGVGKFNAVSFYVIDAADAGAKFSIKVGETLFSQILGGSGKTANGNIQLVTILLPQAVTNLTVQLMNSKLNDGFGIDGATVANVAPIPVPPAAALLVTGIVAMGALRRRRRAAQI